MTNELYLKQEKEKREVEISTAVFVDLTFSSKLRILKVPIEMRKQQPAWLGPLPLNRYILSVFRISLLSQILKYLVTCPGAFSRRLHKFVSQDSVPVD